jgi:hypothetical protein
VICSNGGNAVDEGKVKDLADALMYMPLEDAILVVKILEVQKGDKAKSAKDLADSLVKLVLLYISCPKLFKAERMRAF